MAITPQVLGIVPLSAVAAGPAVGSEAASQGWTSHIHWKSRQLAPGVTVRSGILSNHAPGAERISEAIIDPGRARIEVTHDGIVARRQRTSTVAHRWRALVAVNAGFFITSSADGFPGAPTGLAVYGGRLESLNNGPRAALIISNGRPRIAVAEATVTVRAGRAAHLINGINRIPGVIADCGRPGGRPTAQPRQDVTCTDDDELVLFTSQLGAPAPRGPGSQAVLRPDGTVISKSARAGGRVPAAGWVIQGIGAAATWLAKHAIVGHRLVITERVADATGHPIPLSSGVSIASGAPILLRNGRIAVNAVREGVLDPADPSFGYAWAKQPQPRTVAGIDRHGRLILVTVDGRQPGLSEGVTLNEEASLMQSLGAVDAMNLDGGGSTAMAVNGTLFNRPSDPGGERADGDFIVAEKGKTLAGAGSPCATVKSPGHYTHVIWVWMENHSYGTVIGSKQAPYLNRLAADCGLATNYHNITHPSLPNYIAATSGLGYSQLAAFDSDCAPAAGCATKAPSIFSQGETWRAYAESMPSNCHRANSGEYAVRHNPPPYYTKLHGCSSSDVPYSRLAADLARGRLPAFSFITPNLIDDMHDGTIADGDRWLAAALPKIFSSPQYRNGSTAVFITWDEGEGGTSQRCAANTRDVGCRVVTIVVSPSTPRGARSARLFNHYSLLATAEQLLHLRRLGKAAVAATLTAAFKL